MYHLVDFCRLCLSFKGEFSDMCNDNIMEKLVACINDLEFDEKLPALICAKCSEQLDMFFDFRNQCLRSEFLLNCYIDKFPRTQPCNKFVSTQLKVNLLKNCATSSKLLSNVQTSKEHLLKLSSYNSNNNNSKDLKICESVRSTGNSSHNHKRCSVVLKDVMDFFKTNPNNNQNSLIQLNESHALNKPNLNKLVFGNNIDNGGTSEIFGNNIDNDDTSEDEDDVFFEEEDDETLQLENANKTLNNETENGKRKSDHSENLLNKKSRLETNSLIISGESSESKQKDQVESNYIYNLENDASFLPLNMQADITEHVKIRKRKVQILAQEKMRQALNDKVQTKTKKSANLQKGTSLCHNRNTCNAKRSSIKNFKLKHPRRSAVLPNTEMNKLNNSALKTNSNSTTYNILINQLISDEFHNFNDLPVNHSTNIDKLIDSKLQNFKNIPVTTNITPDKFKNPEFYNIINNPPTRDMQTNEVEDLELQTVGCVSELCDFETNSTFRNHMKRDNIALINTTQDLQNSSVFIGYNHHIELDKIKQSDLQNLKDIYTDQVNNTESQNLETFAMTHNIEIDTVKNFELLQDMRSSRITHNNETDNIQDAESQNIEVGKIIRNTESQNFRSPGLHNNEAHTIDNDESHDVKSKPVTCNNESDNMENCEALGISNNSVNCENIQDINSQNSENGSVTHYRVITTTAKSKILESIPVAYNTETYNSRESQSSMSNMISHNTEVNKPKNVVEERIMETSSIDPKMFKSNSIKLQSFSQKHSRNEDLKANDINKLAVINTDMDYEDNLDLFCISNTKLPSKKEISKPFAQLPRKTNFANIPKYPFTKMKKLNKGSNMEKTPFQISPNFKAFPLRIMMPQNMQQTLYQDRGITNEKVIEDSAESYSSLFVQNIPILQTNQIVLTQSVNHSSFATLNNKTSVQNPQILDAEINFHQVKAPGSLYSSICQNAEGISSIPAYQLLRPKHNITLKPMKSILKKELMKNSNTSRINKAKKIMLSNKPLVDSVKFEDFTDDTLNVGANLTIPLYSREMLDRNYSLLRSNSEKSLFGISNSESIQLPSLICDGESNSKSEDYNALNIDVSVATEHNDKSNTYNSHYPFLSETPSTSTANCEDYNSFNIDASLVAEDCYMPHNDHNYNSKPNYSHFLNQIPCSSAASTINKMPVINGKIKKKSVSNRVSRLLQNLQLTKKNRSKIHRKRPTFILDDPLNILKPLKKISTVRNKRTRRKSKKRGGSKSGKKEDKSARADQSKQTLHVEKDKDSDDFVNITTIDSEDSEIDVVTVSEPRISYNSFDSPKEDEPENKNDLEKYRRMELRKRINFLCGVIPNKIFPPYTAISIKGTIDSATHYIKTLKNESQQLEEEYSRELHKQNELFKKLEDIKQEGKN